jgi:hypothetical protein
MDQQFFQWALSQGGLAGVLLIVIWLWRSDRKEADRRNEEREKKLIEVIEKQDGITNTLIKLVQNNAETFTRLTGAIEGLEKVVANCGLAQRITGLNRGTIERARD